MAVVKIFISRYNWYEIGLLKVNTSAQWRKSLEKEHKESQKHFPVIFMTKRYENYYINVVLNVLLITIGFVEKTGREEGWYIQRRLHFKRKDDILGKRQQTRTRYVLLMNIHSDRVCTQCHVLLILNTDTSGLKLFKDLCIPISSLFKQHQSSPSPAQS